MNIKQALTLRFVLVFALLWIAASLAIYYSSAEFRREEFYQRLHTRATTTARLLIEVEEVDAQLLRKIDAANPIRLPGERITIYDYNNAELFSTDAEDSIFVSSAQFDEIRLEGEVHWRQGAIEVLGLLFTDKYDRFVVVASGQDIYGYRKLDYLRNILLIVFVIALIVITIAAMIYAGRALQPISKVVEEVNQIGFTNLHDRVSEGNGKDEIATLGITFNKMLTRIEAASESQKSFISNASHELRTPMTSMLSQVDVVLLKDRSADFYKNTLSSVRDDIHKLSVLAARLLLLARVEAFRETFKPVRIDAMLWQAIGDVSKYFKNPIIPDFSADIDDERYLTITGSDQLIKSTLQNVLENACKYSNGQEVKVDVQISGDQVKLLISDKGIGIPEVDLARIGEPFFRGSNTATVSGSGIGLNLVRKIVEIHEGDFQIQSSQESGTTVTLSFRFTEVA